MSANIEYALISQVILNHDYHTLEKMQVTADFFTVPEVKAIYEYLRITYHNPTTAGLVPSVDMVRQYFPSFTPVTAPDTVPILCQALRDSKLRMELLSLAQILTMEADKDPYTSLAKLKGAVQTLASIEHVGHDLSMSAAYQLLMERYNSVSSAGGILGIPFPWDVLNQELQGMQDGNYLVLYGRPGSMKTWVAIYMAVHAYLKSRRRVLYYTREMPELQIGMRVAATMCGIDYHAFKNGQLEPNLLAWVQCILQGLMADEVDAGKHGHQPCFVITADRSQSGGGVTWLQAKIQEVDPDIVFVDGVYLMRDDRSNQRNTDWKNILHISQDLRQMALGLNIPIVAITQANKQSDKVRGTDFVDMAFTDAFNQDADAVFKVKHVMSIDEATKTKKSEIYMWSPKLREGVLDGIVINGVPSTNFEFVRPLINEGDGEPEYGESEKKPAVKPPTAAFRKDPANYYQTPKIPALK